MSVMVLDDVHFNVVTSYAAYIKASFIHSGQRHDIAECDLSEIATILYKANVDAYDFQYSDDSPAEELQFNYELRPELGPVVIMKLLDCIEYQCINDVHFNGSLAHSIIAGIRTATIKRLPGYSDAPWSINKSTINELV